MLGKPISFDALLMAAVALRDNLPPIGFGQRIDIAIPIAQERGIYLSSVSQQTVECHERRHINKRFPMAEAQMLGARKMSINPKGGLSKGFRLPAEVSHMVGDIVTFYAVGDIEGVRELLQWVQYLGKRRGVGLGKVTRWDVAEHEAWPGFPVMRDGKPMRPLPLDWPGIGEHRKEYRVLTPPYWEQHREELCAC